MANTQTSYLEGAILGVAIFRTICNWEVEILGVVFILIYMSPYVPCALAQAHGHVSGYGL